MVQSLESLIFFCFKGNKGYFEGIENATLLIPAQIERRSMLV
jgi:hypothetical protein